MAALMIQGTSSWAGKSLLTTALCRLFARRGLQVAPFKAQNMSNNARVVQGGEIGAAQYLQALAAGVEPDVRMNPVLIKPEGDDKSQVVIDGVVDRELSLTPWPERQRRLWPVIANALRSLLDEFELVVIEGAGSPAEINLREFDLVNMRVAAAADAPVVLVADIYRGGAFAHLYGTWALLDEQERRRIRGFVLNKFRGNPALLSSGPEQLEQLTGVPTLGVLPWLDHGLPDEDGAGPPAARPGQPRVAIVRYPTASNLDEFRALEEVAQVVWADEPEDLAGATLVVLPGSKHVAGDLEWLTRSRLDAAIKWHVADGGLVLGICGGLQLLGDRIEDPHGVDGEGDGLGLLPLRTSFSPEKLTRRTETRFAELGPPWQSLSRLPVSGYEIRYGETTVTGRADLALPDGLGFACGPVLGVYVHGLLEDPMVVATVLGTAPARTLEDAFDELADAVERHLDLAPVEELVGVSVSGRSHPHAPPLKHETPPPSRERLRSLVLVNTGEGKGKSTAAFGIVMRAVARGWRACVIQFVKSDKWQVGEEKVARDLGVDWLKGGDGFTWESPDLAKSEGRARAAWQLAAAAIASGDYQLVVLDEITYPINWGWIGGGAVIEAIRGRPAEVNVVATGRDAPPSLIELADTVTEMVKVKHVYDRGVKARRGIDF